MSEKTTITETAATDAPNDQQQSTEEQDAWLKAEIEATLIKKADGSMTYRSLDEVMRKFGFDVR